MSQQPDKPSFFDRVKKKTSEHWKGPTAAVLVGLGVAGIGACGSPSNATAERAPTTISSTATPGSSETPTTTTPSAAETTPSAEAYTLQLEDSDIYKSLTPAEQEKVTELSKLSFEDFINPNVVTNEDRGLAGAVFADAYSAGFLTELSKIHLDGQPGLLGPIAKENYDWANGRGVEQITAGDNYGPAAQVNFRRDIAYFMAKKGDKAQLTVAKEIYASTVYYETLDSANKIDRGNLKSQFEKLDKISADKADPEGATLHYGLVGTYMSNLDGMPKTVAVGFNVWDANSSTSVPGTNDEGMAACAYQLTTFSPKRIVSQEYVCDPADGSTNNVMGSLRPNTP